MSFVCQPSEGDEALSHSDEALSHSLQMDILVTQETLRHSRIQGYHPTDAWVRPARHGEEPALLTHSAHSGPDL
jgi:uncharacterized protein (DUF302 family)